MPTIITAAAPTDHNPDAPDWCRYIDSGVYRFTAGDHLFTMIFSEVEVARDTAWQLVKQIQASVKQQGDLHDGLATICEQHGTAEWDRTHQCLTMRVCS
jgi:hypothetical protein